MSGLLLLRRRLFAKDAYLRLSQVRHYALIGKPSQHVKPAWALPEAPARTRFAPSPTGYLHLGSLRTALFNYLLAQATGGQFILRLEDTDQARFVPDAEKRLYDDMTWAGLHWDEGPDKGGPYGPYKQSERLALYQQHAQTLLDSDRAFRCFCSKEDLEFNIREATASGGTAHYPGTCTHMSRSESDRRAANGEPHTIRFKSAETPVSAPDIVYGAYRKNEREDNFIIIKSDGYPTYHFANVIDDHFMEITHVIRGAEWLISTPKHVELYNAFGWQIPNFAHVGLLVDSQRQKLSKRDMDNIGIGSYRANNVLPEALLNFSALLGWDPNLQKNSHLNKQGVLTVDEMIKNFTLKFTRGDIVVDLAKLKFFQTKLIKNLVSGDNDNPEILSKSIIKPVFAEIQTIRNALRNHSVPVTPDYDELRRVLPTISDSPMDRFDLNEDLVRDLLKVWKKSITEPVQFVYDNIYAFFPVHKTTQTQSFHELTDGMRRLRIKSASFQKMAGSVNTDLSDLLKWLRLSLQEDRTPEWNLEVLGPRVKELVQAITFYDTNMDQVMDQSAGWKILRWALVNGSPGLPLVPLMALWGRDETMWRIKQARKVAKREEERLLKRAQIETGWDELNKVRSEGRWDQNADLEAKQQTVTRSNSGMDYKAPARPVMEETPPALKPSPDTQTQMPGLEEQHKGPFVSRGPRPPPSKSPRKSPSEVDRVPTFLKFDEWKQGTRRLDVGTPPKAGSGPQTEGADVAHSTPSTTPPDSKSKSGSGPQPFTSSHMGPFAFSELVDDSQYIDKPIPETKPRPVSKNNSTRSFDSGSSGLGLPRDDVHDHFVNRIRKINAEKKIRMEDRVRSENEDFVRPWPGSYPKRLDRLKALQSGPLSLSRVRSQSQPSNASPSGSEPPLLDAETHAKLIRERIRTAMAYKQQRAQEFKELYGVPQQAGVGARHIWRTSSSQSDSSTAVEEEKGLQANQGRQIESASYVKQTSQANHSDFKNFENFANHANQATQTTNANKTGKSRRRQKHEQDEEALPVFGPITRARMRWERKRARRLAEKIARNPNWEEADRRRKAARHARKVAEWEQLKAQRQEERREWRARKAYSKGNDWK